MAAITLRVNGKAHTVDVEPSTPLSLYPMRRVAAEARRVLLDMASTRLGVPVSALAVSDGVVSMIQTPATPEVRHAETSVTYGDLIGGKRFNITLTGKNTDTTTGIAKRASAADEERRLPAAVPRPKSAWG